MIDYDQYGLKTTAGGSAWYLTQSVKDMTEHANNAGTEDPHKLDNQDLKGTGMKWVTKKEVKKV